MFEIAGRKIGEEHPPFIIAEAGINPNGCIETAIDMVDAAKAAGADAIKFQCHIPSEELCEEAKEIYPPGSSHSIWEILEHTAFTEEEDRRIKEHADDLDIIYLSTPFSIAAVERLERMGVAAYKIGSGDLTNLPFLRHINGLGKPVILSTGMSDWAEKISALDAYCSVDLALLHCVSMYPTPYIDAQLERMHDLRGYDAEVGLSDHSIGNYLSFAAVAMGATIIEKHVKLDGDESGPDANVSITMTELADLVKGCRAVWEAMQKHTTAVLPGEQIVRDWYQRSRKRA